jgi:hypothetical protein
MEKMFRSSEQLLNGFQIFIGRAVMKGHTITEGEETAEFGTKVETGLESLKHYLWYGMVARHGYAVARRHRV